MFIKSIKINNILGVKSKEYNLDRELVLITGANGKGKSTIFESITIALFGKGIRYSGLEQFLGSNGNVFSAELVFTHLSEEYKILRTYTYKDNKGSSDVVIYKKNVDGWENITPKGNIKTQTYINSKIGLDYDSFIAISLISSASKNILFETGGEILKQITKILDIDIISKIKENIKESQKNLESLKKILIQKEDELKTKKQLLLENKRKLSEINYVEFDFTLINNIKSKISTIEDIGKDIAIKEQSYKSLVGKIESIKDRSGDGIIKAKNNIDTLIESKTKTIAQKNALIPNEDIDAKIQEINNKISLYTSSLSLIKSLEDDMKKMYFESKSIFDKYSIDIFSKPDSPITKLESILNREQELEKKKDLLISNISKLEFLISKENSVSTSTCPTCGNDMTKEHFLHIKNECSLLKKDLEKVNKKIKYSSAIVNKDLIIVNSNKDKRIEAKSKIDNLKDSIKDIDIVMLKKELEKYQGYQKIKSDIYDINNEINMLNKRKSDLDATVNIISSISELNYKRNKNINEYYELLQSILDIDTKTAVVIFGDNLLTKINNDNKYILSNDDIKTIENNIISNNKNKDEKTKLGGVIETLNTDIIEIERKIKELDGETKDLPMYKEAVKLVNILPNYALYTISPTLEKITNEILEYFEDKIKISFEINTEVADNNRNAINLFATRDGKNLPIVMLSSGQQSKVNFSFKFAMSALLSQVLNKKTSVLFIDEGFGYLDKESRLKLSHSIKQIHQKVEQVFLITHIDDVKDIIINENKDLLHINIE